MSPEERVGKNESLIGCIQGQYSKHFMERINSNDLLKGGLYWINCFLTGMYKAEYVRQKNVYVFGTFWLIFSELQDKSLKKQDF